jgi:DNA mismatch repair protein MutH
MLPYNPNNKDSIIEFAKQLIGKSVNSQFKELIPKLNLSNNDKGQLGKVIEELYFQYKPNSKSAADFKEAGLELKSSGLKQLKNKDYRAKERLALNIINFVNAISQKFDDDFLIGKNSHLLLVFYLYQKNINQLSSIIKIVGDWKYPNEDLEIIKKDWELIKQKIVDGKAHELSEGDTFYLGASTKGSKGGNFRRQPNSKIYAKQRAYSLKQGYLNHIIASIANETAGVYGKLIPSLAVAKNQTLEEIVISKLIPYYGKTIEQILALIDIKLNIKSKSFYASITKAMLGIELNKEIEEFEKADIFIKTVRLKQNNLPEQNISFPNFKYEEIVNEEWDNSNFKDILEHKFLFVFFQFKNEELVLRKAKFWNMPYVDILEAEKVWAKTKEIVLKGEIVKGFKTDKKGKESRVTNFPGKKFNSVSHVRPHTTNSLHTFPLPIEDKFTKEKKYTQHCFWLNDTYVKDEIYLK